MTGAQALVRSLEDEGVDILFGLPGGVVLPVFDQLYDSSIRTVLVRHEQGAIHAAEGYARATGKVGTCIVTSGPGATNIVTGMADAYMDSTPLVVITGQVATNMIGTDAFQEADITGITLPVAKHSFLLKDARNLPEVVAEAFHIARTGRAGPVLIDMPVDVSRQEMNYEGLGQVRLPGYKPTLKGHKRQIEAAARAILAAKRPLVYAGGGVISAGASKELAQLARENLIPVTHSLMGKGCFPETDKLSLGMLGMHGTRYANYSVCETDLLLAVGARFSDRVTGKLSEFAPHAAVVHIDIDPAEIGKNVRVDIPIVGDCRLVLKELNEILASLRGNKSSPRRDWTAQVEEWKRKFPMGYELEGKLKPQYVVERIYYLTKGKATICTEVGQNQMWAAQYYLYKEPRSFISSGGLGTMGYGFPAAIGAKLACPEKTVFDIAGDGSIQMNIQELGTAMQYKIPVIICILNNQYLGMVRQWQELFHEGRYSYTDMSHQPDFVKLAEAYGAVGMRVNRTEDVRGALQEAMQITDRPVIIDFWVEREAGVYPMVPPGESILNMLGGDLDE